MTTQRIAIIAAGEMGAAVGARLVDAGHVVSTMLAGRGTETATRAAEAGMKDCPTIGDLLDHADLFLSIVPPAVAKSVADAVAAHHRETGRSLEFIDCNAISPERMRTIAEAFEGTRVQVIDGGIVGAPPVTRLPRLYLSGPQSAYCDTLQGTAFECRYLGPEIGAASAFKLSYAGLTKGVNALTAAVFMNADAYGLLDELIAEVSSSQTGLWDRAQSYLPRLPADAGRWADEMEEIAICFAEAGLPPEFHQGAAAIMKSLAASRYGSETRRSRDRNRDFRTTVIGLRP